ncbi:hypothetical protein [Paracidovorax wautersii]|uniref:Antitoxin (DNA-binding transcriptional repressor) of toxin-antitoxin stability system n=1 Tax=Paracidovorax wautersii TaxID=1177982 RepID=A0ABU1ICH7_9BURK|nr:hypothetical protein [Paracidovorax wautersii]MDR6214930.1 antitoxin (DNA-binding transcriptional repressor) of toxin-antitoxin stability system [Paracidovorax wautersii]
MPLSHATLIPLYEAAAAFPAGHALSQALMARAEASAVGHDHAWVLQVHGDLELASLDLQAPLAGLADSLPAGGADAPAAPCLLLVQGALRVAGALIAPSTPAGCALYVRGDLSCGHALLSGDAAVEVEGRLQVAGLLWCGDGPEDASVDANAAAHAPPAALAVHGTLKAAVAVFTSGVRVQLPGEKHIGLCLDAARQDPRHAALAHEALALRLVPGLLQPMAPAPDSVSALVDLPRLRAALQAGEPVLRGDPEAQLPMDAALCPGPAPTLAQLHQLLRAALPDKTRHKAQGWFGQTDFLLTRRHQDEDGDTYHDGLFLTEWKAWDFWFSDVPAPEARSLLGAAAAGVRRLAAAPWRRTAPALAPGFAQLFRAYGADGRPGAWQPLAGPQAAAPTEALQACALAWQGVVDYWRKAEGQRRAGHPLHQRLLAELTPARAEALTLRPVFTAQYDDWWDSERNGWWEGDLWVGARQPCVRHGRRWGRALKLSWENGPPGPGDADDDTLASYQIDIERDGAGRPALRITYAQRQGDERVPLPLHAVDHTARLLRLFAGIAQRLEQTSAQPAARDAEARRIAAEVQLLRTPPFAPHLPDDAVLPTALLAASDAWQADGRAFVAQVRARLAAESESESEAAAPGSGGGALPPWPEDARRHRADTVLQLARVVSRHADADLAARLHHRFAFAPEAFAGHAAAAGRAVGPVFLLDGGTIVARIAPAQDQAAQWLRASADGLQVQPLDGVRSVGRSASRTCFAIDAGDGVLTMREGWDGPVLARLPMPAEALSDDGPNAGEEDGAATAAAGPTQILPSDDGQSALLRTRSGHLYRTDATGVQRVPPADGAAPAGLAWPAAGDAPTATAQGLVVRGDGNGGLRADLQDRPASGPGLWRHPVGGGALCGLDMARDGRTLVAGSRGGYLVLLRKGPGLDPFAAGTSRFAEAWRLIFWHGEDAPIRW